ncbi:MAG: hypothetical protein ACW98D_14380 [Promethearchaeota archaeon]|jgi:hypothetical protein
MNDKPPLKTFRSLIGIFNRIEYSVQLEMKNEDITINLYREGDLAVSKNLHAANLSVGYIDSELIPWITEKIDIPSLDPYDLQYNIIQAVLSVVGFFKHERERRAVEEAVMKDKELMEFKLGMGQLTNEAIEIIKRKRELEGEFERLMERKRAGEVVKDILKRNKVKLKRLKKQELEIYSECKKNFKIEKARRKVLRRQKEEIAIKTYKTLGEEDNIDQLSKIRQNYKFRKFKPKDLWLFLNTNTSEEDQRILYIRILELADKLRLKRIKICIVLVLISVLPMVSYFIFS